MREKINFNVIEITKTKDMKEIQRLINHIINKLITNEFYKRQIEEQGLNKKEHAAEIAMYILEEEFADDFAKFISE